MKQISEEQLGQLRHYSQKEIDKMPDCHCSDSEKYECAKHETQEGTLACPKCFEVIKNDNGRIATEALAEKEEVCEWGSCKTGECLLTECGVQEEMSLHNYKYCPWCGKKIKETK